MKRIILIAFLFLSILANSQNYKLFKPSSLKAYATLPLLDSTLSLKFDSATYDGADSIYHVYKSLSDEWINGESCNFWLGDECHPQNKPKWLGNSVLFDENHNYKFITLANDTLFMDFPQLQGASFNFYEDATQRFSITYEGKHTASILGVLDSVQNYRINHFDLAGNTIQSPLNNHLIMVGKTLGLIQFFQIDLFPNTLKPLRLIGNMAPNVGFYQITEGMAYDFQAGDEIQYHAFDKYNGGGIIHYFQNYNLKYTILERKDSVNTITYRAISEKFNVDFTDYVYDTVILVFRNDLVIMNIPFDEEKHGNTHVTRSLYKMPYCDLNFMTYQSSFDYEFDYCESTNCWGYGDTFGPPATEIKTYVFGLGLYSDYYHKYENPMSSYVERNKYVIYFKKNGVICGDEIIVGKPELMAVKTSFSVFPNPSTTSLKITSELDVFATVTIINLTGQEVQNETINGQSTTLDISKLKSGIYLLQIISGNKVEVRKIVKE